jgi:hypothetical protein
MNSESAFGNGIGRPHTGQTGFLSQRLMSALKQLREAAEGTQSATAPVKGHAREMFINQFLRKVMPPEFRISGNGEAIDSSGEKSGELDVIVENSFLPSIPFFGTDGDSSRLFFCEGIASVIEIKSNLSDEWSNILAAAEKLRALNRRLIGGTQVFSGGSVVTTLPFEFKGPAAKELPKLKPHPEDDLRKKVQYFVVGYHGWKTTETIDAKLESAQPNVAGILQIDIGYFKANARFRDLSAKAQWSLLGLIDCVHRSATAIQGATADLISYAR